MHPTRLITNPDQHCGIRDRACSLLFVCQAAHACLVPFFVCVSRSDGPDVGGPSLAVAAVLRPHPARPLRLPTGACTYIHIEDSLRYAYRYVCICIYSYIGFLMPAVFPPYVANVCAVHTQLDDLAMRPLALLRKLQHLSLRHCNQLCTSIRL